MNEHCMQFVLADEGTNQVSANFESNIPQLGFNFEWMAANVNAGWWQRVFWCFVRRFEECHSVQKPPMMCFQLFNLQNRGWHAFWSQDYFVHVHAARKIVLLKQGMSTLDSDNLESLYATRRLLLKFPVSTRLLILSSYTSLVNHTWKTLSSQGIASNLNEDSPKPMKYETIH